MVVKEIRLHQYRNIQTATLKPARHLTILYGSNGQGKTNILESLYLLGNGRSFRHVKVPDLIEHNSQKATVRASIQSSGIQSDVCIELENNSRRITIDGKAVHRASDLHGKLAVVVFSPDDTAMVKLGPETRRRFLDRSLYMSHVDFLPDYHNYYRTLKQRNVLLKNQQINGLDIWTEQLAVTGFRLMERRRAHALRLNRLLQKQYQKWAGADEKVEICYHPDLTENSVADPENYVILLQQQQDADIRHRTTVRGPHRDDLQFLIQSKPLKRFGSQGQQRSFILALKMAELEYLSETFSEMPVLLLDDIASELDRKRISNLLTYIREQQVQTVITTTDITSFFPFIEQDSCLLKVEEGRMTYEGNRTT